MIGSVMDTGFICLEAMDQTPCESLGEKHCDMFMEKLIKI